jgi:hypothetical protein
MDSLPSDGLTGTRGQRPVASAAQYPRGAFDASRSRRPHFDTGRRRALQAALTPAGERILADMDAVYVAELEGSGRPDGRGVRNDHELLEKVAAATRSSRALATPLPE